MSSWRALRQPFWRAASNSAQVVTQGQHAPELAAFMGKPGDPEADTRDDARLGALEAAEAGAFCTSHNLFFGHFSLSHLNTRPGSTFSCFNKCFQVTVEHTPHILLNFYIKICTSPNLYIQRLLHTEGFFCGAGLKKIRVVHFFQFCVKVTEFR